MVGNVREKVNLDALKAERITKKLEEGFREKCNIRAQAGSVNVKWIHFKNILKATNKINVNLVKCKRRRKPWVTDNIILKMAGRRK